MPRGGARGNSGRKSKYGNLKPVTVKLPETAISKIPGKKSTWICDLVCRELGIEKNTGITEAEVIAYCIFDTIHEQTRRYKDDIECPARIKLVAKGNGLHRNEFVDIRIPKDFDLENKDEPTEHLIIYSGRVQKYYKDKYVVYFSYLSAFKAYTKEEVFLYEVMEREKNSTYLGVGNHG